MISGVGEAVGVGVIVGVSVMVGVGVSVGVEVGVAVSVDVGVAVSVGVAVFVKVGGTGVLVTVGAKFRPGIPPEQADSARSKADISSRNKAILTNDIVSSYTSQKI
jgi:hypothetical protein